jgi:coiled-coil domain-containing protein 64
LSCQSLAEDRNELERLRRESLDQEEELKRKSDEITKLTTKVTIQDSELSGVREERDQLKQDMKSSEGIGKEEIVRKAWEVRDKAVVRKNMVEIELAKTRIEVMHINGQLMEAIQQKIELSQQLEQWQVS